MTTIKRSLVSMLFMYMIAKSKTDKYRREHRKNIRLKEDNQCFQEINKHRESYRYRHDAP